MTYFTGLFGLPPYANLTVVETENGAPNGYLRARHDFPEPARHRPRVNTSCWRTRSRASGGDALVSPATRNHLWLTNGLATYSEMLYAEHNSGPGALETQFHDVGVEALTVDNVPVIQAARLEDYSPELWALTGSKGAAVLHMLRFVIGDEKFFEDAEGIRRTRTPGNRSPRTISSKVARKRCRSRIWATSSSSGSNRAARPSSSWSTRFSARRRASA